MSTQDKDGEEKDKLQPITGSHIAPKGHGAECPCCTPGEEEEE